MPIQIIMPPKKTKGSTAVARESADESVHERDVAPPAEQHPQANAEGAPTQGKCLPPAPL